MKRHSTLIIAFVLLLGHYASAQTPPKPDILNEISYYKKSDNSLLKLERGTAQYVTKTKMLGYGGASTNYVLDGDKSPVRLTVADSLTFVVAVSDDGIDLSTYYLLYKASVKKKKRSGALSSMKVFGGASSSSKDVVPFIVRKRNGQVYEIVPTTKLNKGEYFFVKAASLSSGVAASDAFAFGID